MDIAGWIIPLLLAVSGLCLAISQLGGPRGANQPYPARTWALLGAGGFVAATVLVLLVAFA